MTESAPTERTYGQRLRAARLRRGLTLDQVADDLGTSRQTVIHWEKDQSVPRKYHEAIASYYEDNSFILPEEDGTELAQTRDEVRDLTGYVRRLEARIRALEDGRQPS